MEGGLFVRELFERTCDELMKRNGCGEIVFPEKILVEVADDSDYHRTRKGYFEYEKINLLDLNKKSWVVGTGKKAWGYPADMYDSDIIALPVLAEDKELNQRQDEIRERIIGSEYFRNSLVYGLCDGNLATGSNSSWYKNPYQKRMHEQLENKVNDFVFQLPEYNREIILTSLRHPVTKKLLFKPTFVDFLAEAIETVLKEVEIKEGD